MCELREAFSHTFGLQSSPEKSTILADTGPLSQRFNAVDLQIVLYSDGPTIVDIEHRDSRDKLVSGVRVAVRGTQTVPFIASSGTGERIRVNLPCRFDGGEVQGLITGTLTVKGER